MACRVDDRVERAVAVVRRVEGMAVRGVVVRGTWGEDSGVGGEDGGGGVGGWEAGGLAGAGGVDIVGVGIWI